MTDPQKARKARNVLRGYLLLTPAQRLEQRELWGLRLAAAVSSLQEVAGVEYMALYVQLRRALRDHEKLE